MLPYLSYILLVSALVMVLMATTLLLSPRTPLTREKPSPFECGFDPLGSARIPFSLRFFLLAVVFLVFDVEIALLLPLPIIVMTPLLPPTTTANTLFVFILIFGLAHEWHEGSLKWATWVAPHKALNAFPDVNRSTAHPHSPFPPDNHFMFINPLRPFAPGPTSTPLSRATRNRQQISPRKKPHTAYPPPTPQNYSSPTPYP